MDTTAITKKQLSSGFPFVCYQESYALCGQPQSEDLKEFKKLNWSLILNLRNQEELQNLDFEMTPFCEELGLEYSHIPIIVNGEFDKTALQQIHELLSSQMNKKVVIHCASGKRSILALIAHFLFSKKHSKEELLLLAQQLGFDSQQMPEQLFSAIEDKN